MFKNDEDVRNTLRKINEIKDFIDSHSQDKMNQPVSKELIMEFERIKLSIRFFQEFVDTFLKSLGLTQDEIVKNMRFNVKGRAPGAEKLIREADTLKCQLILSQAELIKNQYKDFLENNRPFTQSKKSKSLEEMQKKKVKKKFKTMQRRQKWDKL